MNRLLLILFLTLSFYPLTNAEDIRDFEIEGMSIGDNLINHMTKKEINYNDQGHYPKNSIFFEVNYTGTKNQYDYVNLGVKRRDRNFKIYYIRAMNVVNNKNKCIKIKKKITKDFKKLFPNSYFQEGSQKHYFYKNSTQYISQFSIKANANQSDHTRVECMIVSDKDKKIHGNLMSTLEVIISAEEFSKWLDNL
ncbi:hypothetical protein ACIJYD_03145 [Candidatus Pelagibacter bacterium nBUS_33]|uniref:hypothetical protein n=1 Tax=Candidatus Pelagibacter bacterium nBUS_33 TaxID=3374193 RepID=UPI003EBF5FAE